MKPLLVRTGGHAAAKLATKSGGVARMVMAGRFASDEASGPLWSTFLAGAPLDKVVNALECGVTASPPMPTVAMFKSAAGERANVSLPTLRSCTGETQA